MSINCCIDLENNPMRVVYAGQLLRGTVRLKLMDKTTVSSIYIRISGKVFAQWKVGNSVVTAKEDCLDERIQLVGDTFGNLYCVFHDGKIFPLLTFDATDSLNRCIDFHIKFKNKMNFILIDDSIRKIGAGRLQSHI